MTTTTKRRRKTEEEKLIEQAEKEERKRLRLIKKEEREKEKAAKAAAKAEEKVVSEEQIVTKYVNRIINNQRYHGRVDTTRHPNMKYDKKVNKNIWMDNQFYFSVVFQSADQLGKFIDELGITVEEQQEIAVGGTLKIVNGLKFAEKLGISIEKIKAENYPLANLELMPYVLDNEEV